jgi:spermidine dehydrogenase
MPLIGFGPRITRRDFLNGALLSVGGAMLGCGLPKQTLDPGTGGRSSLGPDWYGYGGVGDYRFSHGNTPEVVETAHRLRDQGFPSDFGRVDSSETYDLVIVGAGLAGLGAALEFTKRRREGQTCLMLDNHPIFGGEAKENEFNVDGVRLIGPQGSNSFFIPEVPKDPDAAVGDARYYAELGVPREFQFRDWPATEKPLRFPRDNYEHLVRGLLEHTSLGHYFAGAHGGTWAIDMWQQRLANTPLSEDAHRTLLQWYGSGAMRHFESAEVAAKALDIMSYQQFLEQELHLGPEAARAADLLLASAVGLGSDAISAFVAYELPLPALADPLPPDLRRASFPGGNSGFVRHFLKRLIPDAISGTTSFEDIITASINLEALDRAGQPLRVRLRSTALSVRHDGDPSSASTVRIVYTRDGRFHELKARAVIMATGGWINRYVVRDMPQEHRTAYEQFIHAPFLVANVALTNWRFLHRLGITAATWDRGEGDFGFTCNIRNPMQVGGYQPPLDPDRPTILSFYTPFHRPGLPARAQATQGRMELLTTTYPQFEQKIHAQMMKLFAASGFTPEKDVAGLILNRWGHALTVPFPGFFGGASGQAPRDVIRHGYGRIAFAHSELVGWQHWGPAADEGRRGFNQLVSAI